MKKSRALVAVDVGTGSARAGVVDAHGELIGRGEAAIAMNRPAPGHAEHDSEDIWNAVGEAVRTARRVAGIEGERIAGIAFDATCSLVVLDQEDQPLGVSNRGEDRWNTIVWLDHRAVVEAEECTTTGHRVLDFVGSTMSPEMEIPKLMWLKRHLADRWSRLGRVLDLADFLGWRASGSNARSACTLACKWTYLAHQQPGWQEDFLSAVGLEDLNDRAALPAQATAVGVPLGPLTPRAAVDLDLPETCLVGCGLIDAHAGTLGVLGTSLAGGAASLDRRVALIAGTSSCLMALSAEPRPVRGVWGPYYGAVVPGLWVNEGGQSVTGALLDHILDLHAEGRPLGAGAHAAVLERIAALRAAEGPAFADRLHVLPDFHGNRSPLADPHAVGVISGLTLDASLDSLARLYFRTAVGVALGTRHVRDALDAQGYAIDTLHITGGHVKNPLLMQLYADATGCRVVTAKQEDAVLLGTAMVAAVAAGVHPDLASAAAAMSAEGKTISPDPATSYDRDYRVFLEMHAQRRALDAIV